MTLPFLKESVTPLIALAALIAILAEAGFYFTQQRRPLPRPWLVGSTLLPYLIYSIPAGVFDFRSAAAIVVMTIIALHWFRWLPPSRLTDFAFLALVASPLLFKWFGIIYARPDPSLRLEFLGQLMWIRTAVASVMNDRRPGGVGFGFWPAPREWRTGLIWFLAFLPVALILFQLTGFARFQPPALPAWQLALVALGTFFGILWVVALSEEFLFRGLLQQWLTAWTGSALFGIVVASALFGAVHLGFREFPNWKFSLIAGVAGIFYGLAYRAGNGIRSAMVAHALVVTFWRTLFR